MADEVPEELLALRASIDNIDAALIYLLAERFKCTQKVGRLKARLRLPPADPAREAQQIARLRALAEGARAEIDTRPASTAMRAVYRNRSAKAVPLERTIVSKRIPGKFRIRHPPA